MWCRTGLAFYLLLSKRKKLKSRSCLFLLGMRVGRGMVIDRRVSLGRRGIMGSMMSMGMMIDMGIRMTMDTRTTIMGTRMKDTGTRMILDRTLRRLRFLSPLKRDECDIVSSMWVYTGFEQHYECILQVAIKRVPPCMRDGLY
ncbi:hypothetical protein B0J17DRAFT_331458 [Rhizoctonia solani]|nr:hypothetical protein B0J17DRAFT_331458 [Rhizoctonia solani]